MTINQIWNMKILIIVLYFGGTLKSKYQNFWQLKKIT